MMQELLNRVFFTFFMIFLLKIGSYLPVSGIDISLLEGIAGSKGEGFLNIMNNLSGGALLRGSIFALYIGPYITASIIMQMLPHVYEPLKEIRDGFDGREVLSSYTKYLSIVIAIMQSYGAAMFLESQSVVIEPGYLFRFICVLNMTIGTIILVWISEQISLYGIGNGSSIVILVGIVSGLPGGVIYFFDIFKRNLIDINQLLIVVFLLLLLLILTIYCEVAARKVLVQYPRHMHFKSGGLNNNNSYIPLKINVSGVIAPIAALAIMSLPMMLISGFEELKWLGVYFYQGSIAYIITYSLLLILFAFLYPDMIFNPKDVSSRLQMSSGYILGVRPGVATEEYFINILYRLSAVASCYLILLCIAPQVLGGVIGVNIAFGGTTMLIVVNVVVDSIGRLQVYGMDNQYKKIRIKY